MSITAEAVATSAQHLLMAPPHVAAEPAALFVTLRIAKSGVAAYPRAVTSITAEAVATRAQHLQMPLQGVSVESVVLFATVDIPIVVVNV